MSRCERLRLYKNRVIRKILGYTGGGGGAGKLYKELHDLYYSPNVIRVTKSRRVRWARPVARTER